MEYSELINSDIRLVMLRGLEEGSGYALNESVLQSILGAFGHHVSRDKVRTELDWLAEQNLVTLEDVLGVKVATITQRGLDVAGRRSTVSGVKHPGPRG